jgi:hypothetical protein
MERRKKQGKEQRVRGLLGCGLEAASGGMDAADVVREIVGHSEGERRA